MAESLRVGGKHEVMFAAEERDRRLRLQLAPILEGFLHERGEIDGRKLQRHLAFRQTRCIEDGGHQRVHPVELANDGGGKLLLGFRGVHLLQLAYQELGAHPRRAERCLDLVRQPVEHLFADGVGGAWTRFAPPPFDFGTRRPRS